MTVGQIREALFQPSARITPGYQRVSVRLRDGRSVRGFARSRSNIDLRLQDFEGNSPSGRPDFSHPGRNPSLMQPVKASPEDLQGLMAYLSR
jgi:hypothetical protein